jgi:hypothetical protein
VVSDNPARGALYLLGVTDKYKLQIELLVTGILISTLGLRLMGMRNGGGGLCAQTAGRVRVARWCSAVIPSYMHLCAGGTWIWVDFSCACIGALRQDLH